MIHKIKITPLGGLGEIGALNCMVYETETEAIVVDCGSMFPDQETLGVDLIIPDFSYLQKIKKKLKALILTHGHEDHVGAIPFLLQQINLPLYATSFTRALIEQKLLEYTFHLKPKIILFNAGETLHIGSFEIETIHVNHSIIDCCALAIHTAHGFVIHATDWKIDKNPIHKPVTDLKKFSQLGKKGVLALLSDSTSIHEKGVTLSESEVLQRIKKICSKHKGRIIVTLFASNISRIQGLAKIAQSLGRTLSLVGRSMKENTKMARQLGRLCFDDDTIDVAETKNLKPDQVMLLVTGTQGEPRSILTRLATNNFKPFKIQKGDLILYSARIIPGNEKSIFYILNHLCRHGATVVYEGFHDIHTSGHAHQEELKLLTKTLRPRYFIPIHGEYRHLLKHAELCESLKVKRQNIFVIENGTPIFFENKKAVLEAPVPTGRIFIDGYGVGDVNDLVLRDRRQLSDTGIVICILMIDRNNGDILRGPELISRGFINEDESMTVLEKAKEVVLKLLNNFDFEERTDMIEVQEEVRIHLRRFFNKNLNRKPIVIPVIQEV